MARTESRKAPSLVVVVVVVPLVMVLPLLMDDPREAPLKRLLLSPEDQTLLTTPIAAAGTYLLDTLAGPSICGWLDTVSGV